MGSSRCFTGGTECGWIVTDEQVILLKRKPVLRRLFHTLVQHRLAHPELRISSEEIMEKIWPDVKSKSTLVNRLHNTISSLRTLGLREILCSTSAGYRLAPNYSILLERGEPPADFQSQKS